MNASSAEVVHPDRGRPANVLLVENLPTQIIDQQYLSLLFGQYPGFQDARLMKVKHFGYITFADDAQAEYAKQKLQGWLVTPDMPLKISSSDGPIRH
jgi:hypothetical protein